MGSYPLQDLEQQGFTPSVIAALGVASLPGIGWVTLQHLCSPGNVLKLFESESLSEFTSSINGVGGKFAPGNAGIDNWQMLRERVWHQGRVLADQLFSANVHCLTSSSPDYPRRFSDLGSREPFWLFLRGSRDLLNTPSVAVVGTRSPTWAGEFLTHYSVALLAELGVPVVSGLAKGIDSVAHEWALKMQIPTISVLSSGLLSPYPARNANLADRIVAAGGLLVSEYLPQQQPNAEMFVWRNRLQACIATCVIATGWKRSSGTAHTLRFADELNRPTLSTHVSALPRLPDAGLARNHFELPREQEAFRAVVDGALKSFAKSDNKKAVPVCQRTDEPRDENAEPADENKVSSTPRFKGQDQLF